MSLVPPLRRTGMLLCYRGRNIVELLGSCLSDDDTVKQCLVFEFMAGGSLQGRLAARTALTAHQRFDISFESWHNLGPLGGWSVIL